MPSQASRENQAFYDHVPPGRRDYWRKMAACRHRVETLVRELVASPPRVVIDLGCGDGALLEEIRAALPNVECVGVDLSAPQIELNQRITGMRWVVADLDRAFEIPELVASADAVVASEVIEHLDHPDRFLRSTSALLRDGGRLYLSTQTGPVRETERRVGHRRHYTASQLASLLSETGWAPQRVWNTGYPFHDLSKWYANRDPDKSLHEFGAQAYGVRENVICWALRQAFRFNSQKRGAQLFAVAVAA
jgi:2-polyprenyl-3-methyl-5-hydroxy-6-metoxy-1,4-benzoquinol methylase